MEVKVLFRVLEFVSIILYLIVLTIIIYVQFNLNPKVSLDFRFQNKSGCKKFAYILLSVTSKEIENFVKLSCSFVGRESLYYGGSNISKGKSIFALQIDRSSEILLLLVSVLNQAHY